MHHRIRLSNYVKLKRANQLKKNVWQISSHFPIEGNTKERYTRFSKKITSNKNITNVLTDCKRLRLVMRNNEKKTLCVKIFKHHYKFSFSSELYHNSNSKLVE